jgi:hypothetical protein
MSQANKCVLLSTISENEPGDLLLIRERENPLRDKRLNTPGPGPSKAKRSQFSAIQMQREARGQEQPAHHSFDHLITYDS